MGSMLCTKAYDLAAVEERKWEISSPFNAIFMNLSQMIFWTNVFISVHVFVVDTEYL